MKNNTNIIYALYTIEEKEKFFYVGRTNNPKRRLNEHKRDSKTGTEAKYVHIRKKEAAGITWGMQELEVLKGDQYEGDAEDYWLIHLIRSGLLEEVTNMKHGDVTRATKDQLDVMAANTSIRSKEDVRKWKKERAEQTQAERERRAWLKAKKLEEKIRAEAEAERVRKEREIERERERVLFEEIRLQAIREREERLEKEREANARLLQELKIRNEFLRQERFEEEQRDRIRQEMDAKRLEQQRREEEESRAVRERQIEQERQARERFYEQQSDELSKKMKAVEDEGKRQRKVWRQAMRVFREKRQ